MSDGIKNPNALGLSDVMADLPRHVWDSSAEPPKGKSLLARKARRVKAKKVK